MLSLEEHIDWDNLASHRFNNAFYSRTGRPRKYELCAFLKALVLQRIFGYTEDSQLLLTLRNSREMRDFRGFEKVPDAAKLTRFKERFQPYLAEIFESLVEKTEPILIFLFSASLCEDGFLRLLEYNAVSSYPFLACAYSCTLFLRGFAIA